eukprot:TRINITY_DN672_c0_g1_i3.p1 TRINITY_DN672_c0_g1~~TRINITY_DN672_c0_g1_i3.p1  ORF type:complete len:122 (+),score=44.48 TRINITY_DN672_c0_g1_i3:191-556(+)
MCIRDSINAEYGEVFEVRMTTEGVIEVATVDVRKMFAVPIVKQSDMHDEMKSDAMDTIQTAVDTKPSPEAAAKHIKEFMDKKYGQSWHCIIGAGFGYEVTYHRKHLILMYFNGLGILLYKQ